MRGSFRDQVRKTEGNEAMQRVFERSLSLARTVRDQKQHQRGYKVYSLHAPEVECIGKGKGGQEYVFVAVH